MKLINKIGWSFGLTKLKKEAWLVLFFLCLQGVAWGQATVNITVTNPTCSPATTPLSNGEIKVDVTSGTPNFTYNLKYTSGGVVLATSGSTSLTSYTFTGLMASNYVIEVVNASGTATSNASVVNLNGVFGIGNYTDVSCNGGNNGTAQFVVTGGKTPYSFSWSNSSTTQNVSGLTAGTYNCTVTDNAGCQVTKSVTISEPSALVSNWTVNTNPQCLQGNSFNFSGVTVSTSGLPITSYSWNFGSGSTPSTSTATNVSGVAYSTSGVKSVSLTITDLNGCQNTYTSNVTLNSLPTVILTTNNITCNGLTNGSVSLNPNSGTAPYTYSWAGTGSVSGVTANTAGMSSLAAGTYNYVVTDANGCTKSGSATVQEPSVISVSAKAKTSVSCNGGSNGAVNITVTGGSPIGSPSYSYSWTGPSSYTASTQNISGLAAGVYNLTINDGNSCTGTDSVLISEPTAISIANSKVDVLCNGQTTGSIDITATGGVGPYTYSWSGPGTFSSTNEDLTNLIAGSYTVTVTDANSCIKTSTITVSEPTAISISSTQVNVLCNGASTASIDLTVSGGSPTYSAAWTGPSSYTASTEDITNLAAGSYTVTVTDANSCVKTSTVVITEPTAISISSTQVNVLCNGASTASIDLTVSGGSPTYAAAWTGPSSYTASTEDLSLLAAGTYNVTITDNNLCTKTSSVTITEPTKLTLSSTKVDLLCNGVSTGSINLTISGGVSAFNKSWTGPSSYTSTNEDISALSAGNYSVTVTDANSCTETLSITITQPTQISLVLTTNNITCNGLTNGSVSVSPSGGTSPYTYSWAGTGTVSGVTATTAGMTSLAAGTYNYVVTDANGCTKSGSATVQEPSIISVSAKAKTSVSCNGGSTGAVNITVTGGNPIGSPTYTYAWTGPSSYTASTQNISGLKAGRYDVTITDANSCTGTDSVLISEPTAISIANTKVDVLCNGNTTGSIDITATGGVGPYTYSWSGPGTFSSTNEDLTNLVAGSYTVTVTDANSCIKTSTITVSEPTAISISSTQVNVLCNGASTASIDLTVSGGSPTYSAAWTGPSSFTASTEDLSSLAAGTYNVTITDANSCTKTSSVTITEPTKLTLSSTKVDLLCNGASTGSIDLTISGGVSTYSKSWTGPSSYTSTNEDISSLYAGNYSVTVTDANACTANLSATITEPTAIAASDVITNVTCNGLSDGAINLTVSGGTVASNYTFAWDNSATTEDITGVLAGNYQVTITDDNACTFVKTYTVTEPAVMAISKVISKVLCNGNSDGAINLSVTGGTTPYSYAWTGPSSFSDVTEDITGLVAGDYDITVTDKNNCQISDKITVTEPTAMALGFVRTEVKCKNENNGAIDLTVVGGTIATDYTYDWASIKGYTSAVSDISNLVADEYTYTITDDNGCVLTDTINISEPALLGLNIATVSVCDGQGTLTFNAYGGTSPYTYLVDRVSATSPVTNLPDKVYEVYTTDFNNCRDSVLVNLVHNDGILPTVATNDITVYLDNAGSASILTSQINNGSFDNCSIDTLFLDKYTFNCTNTGANTVTLTVVDINGNSKTKTATVTVLDTISPTITVQNATITVDTSGNAYLLENMVVVTYNDNCSKDTIVLSKNVFAVADKGINNVNVTITDPSGNTVVKTVQVTVLIGDSDNDSIPDYIEKNFDTDSDGKMNYVDVDSDNDGILDIVENDSNKTYQDFDGDGRPNSLDLDSDNDGINDVIEADVLDANGDGVKDDLTVFISNPNNQDLTGNPDYLDLDADDDGLFDAFESKQNYTDSNKDGIIDGVDADGDGILEFADGSGVYKDAFDVAPVDSDGDLIGDWRDKDSDGDKIPDAVELSADKDSDGMPNYLDRDSDNDSIPDAVEAGIDPNNPLNSDTDADPNYLDTDSDGDKISDNLEAGANPKSPVDTDSDTKPDYIDTDSDGDTITDAIEAGSDATNPTDTDNDGIYDFRETDSDDDGILDSVEVGADVNNPADTDGDLLPDYRDLDSDGDGISDKVETGNDFDADGKANYIDTDADNDELLDNTEGTADDDGDGKPNYLDSDVTIPEGFSPNNDGDNDLLVIKGLKVFTKAEITVFNRNGQVVYESGQGYSNNWDGTNKGVNPSLGTTLPEGIYFYVFKYNGQNNQPISGNIYIKP